jgi:hypothetical protein
MMEKVDVTFLERRNERGLQHSWGTIKMLSKFYLENFKYRD